MTTYVALLRGINVGGHNKVAMADLRRLCEDLGYQDVRTHLQSGNVVFRSSRRRPDRIGRELTERMATDLGVGPTVMLRTAAELASVVAANPFAAEAAADPTVVHAAFLSEEPTDPATLAFDAPDYAPERIADGDRVRYLHLPNGIGRSRLATDLARRRAGVEVTVRNWRTVTALSEMAG